MKKKIRVLCPIHVQTGDDQMPVWVPPDHPNKEHLEEGNFTSEDFSVEKLAEELALECPGLSESLLEVWGLMGQGLKE